MEKSNFLILGLCGPMASGCSSLANFLVSDQLNENLQRMIKEKHASNEKEIEEVYDNIKTERQVYTRDIDGGKRDQISELEYDDFAKRANRKLKKCLEKRQFLLTLQKQADFDFRRISLSDIIIKKCLEYIDDPHFAIIPEVFQEELKTFNSPEVLNKFNEVIPQKNYVKLDEEFCKDVHTMLRDINVIKEKIRGKMHNDDYVEVMQTIGNNLRRCGNPFDKETLADSSNLDVLAHEANLLIKFFRHSTDEINQFIIESFRNPSEVDYFRSRYARFFLISIDAPHDKRKESKYFSPKREKFDSGNHNETGAHLQDVSTCVRLSDIALYNHEYNEVYLCRKFLRYLALIVEPGCVPPTKHETLMHEAYSVSLRSNCISRQVGAIITDADGYVVSAGWNDVGVGQIGCGLLIKSDFSVDSAPCSIWNDMVKQLEENGVLNDVEPNQSFCFKDRISRMMIINKIVKLEKENGEDHELYDKIKGSLKIKRLEYARALHAEENALMQLARNGGQGAYGGTIYTTTFPCELCSKKIYQVGLRRIIYTEPYPDAESMRYLQDGTRYIHLIPFEGVKSFSFFKLFKARLDKKDRQKC